MFKILTSAERLRNSFLVDVRHSLPIFDVEKSFGDHGIIESVESHSKLSPIAEAHYGKVETFATKVM